MAVKTKEVEEVEETVEGGTRVSITIDQAIRRKMRIAAAIVDMTVGEWAVAVLTAAARKANADLFSDEED